MVSCGVHHNEHHISCQSINFNVIHDRLIAVIFLNIKLAANTGKHV